MALYAAAAYFSAASARLARVGREELAGQLGLVAALPDQQARLLEEPAVQGEGLGDVVLDVRVVGGTDGSGNALPAKSGFTAAPDVYLTDRRYREGREKGAAGSWASTAPAAHRSAATPPTPP